MCWHGCALLSVVVLANCSSWKGKGVALIRALHSFPCMHNLNCMRAGYSGAMHDMIPQN